MPTFHHLLDRQTPLLLLDAASANIQAGFFAGGGAQGRWASSGEEAGISIFRCVESLAVDLDSIRAFVFCDGPGSILGIRTTAMAIRTWCALAPRPVFAYRSIALVAKAQAPGDFGVIADARRDSWHYCRQDGAIKRLPGSELGGRLLMPEGFRNWTPLPAGVESVPYSLSDLLVRVGEADLFRQVESPDAFMHEEPNYATWTPRIHRKD